jgi:guanylate kinase
VEVLGAKFFIFFSYRRNEACNELKHFKSGIDEFLVNDQLSEALQRVRDKCNSRRMSRWLIFAQNS